MIFIIWQLLLVLVTAFTIRELYVIWLWLKNKDYISWNKKHSLAHFYYFSLYIITLIITWLHIFKWLDEWYIYLSWAISSLFLLLHTIDERNY